MGTLMPERTKALTESSDAFLAYLAEWYAGLEPLDVKADWAANGIAAKNVAVFVVDMVNGFCHAGPLAGERVKALIPPVRAAIERCYALGVRHFLLPQDTHQPDALEFAQFGHALRSGRERIRYRTRTRRLACRRCLHGRRQELFAPGIRHRACGLARPAS